MLKCLQTAKEAGVPQDQAQRLVEAGYIPLPWQWEFHAAAREADLDNGPVDIGAGGARGPGKSHAVLGQAALDDCQRVAGLKGLFLRQTGVSAQESFNDLVDKVLRGRTAYQQTGSLLKFPNGSRILLGGFHDERDIDKYIGIEYDFIIVEELNQLTDEKYTKLRGSLRTSKPNWRPRMYTSFNPGGVGHDLVKSRYVTPYEEGRQKETRFIPSNYRANPYLNKEYIEYLEGLAGDLGKAWRDGDFDIFSGQAFSEFKISLHTMRAVVPSVNLEHYLSIDWGYTDKKPHSFAAYLHAVVKMKTEDGQNFSRVVTYKEWAGNTKTPHAWAEQIYNDCQTMGVKLIKGIADNSMFDPSSSYGKPISKLFTEKWKELNKGDHWLTLVPCIKNRVGRKATVHNWLSMAPDGLPYWLIGENCKWLIITLPKLQTDEHNPEDVDTDGPDDPYDSAGYFLYQLKFVSVKAGPQTYKTTVEQKKIEYDKQGRQMALDSKEFANMYELRK